MTPRNESPTGNGYPQGSSSYREDDAAWEGIEHQRMQADKGRKERLAAEGRPVSMSDHQALALILHSANEASKVFTASGNLELIKQICEQQLNKGAR